MRIEAFTATVSDKVLPSDQPGQFVAEIQRFGDLFCLHYQGLVSLVMETTDALRKIDVLQQMTRRIVLDDIKFFKTGVI